MKIAMLIDGWHPIFGGGQVHVQELCKGLVKKHNCKVDLFVRKLKDENGKKYNQNEILENGKWKIYRIGPTTKFFNIFGRILALINTTIFLFFKAKKEKYNIIHAHAYVSGIPAKVVGKLLKIPIVYTVHGANNLDIGNGGIFKKIEKWLLTGIKYDLELSVGKEFLKYKNVNKNIKVVPNGVDIKKFDNVKVDKKYDGFHFLWVGRFSWEKGLEFLIKGIGLIDKKILEKKQFKLNLVGDGEAKQEIENLVKELNLKKFIKFKGKIFGEKLIEEYKKNNIFILPSLSEGQPLTIFEAFASKIPVIATNVGDNKYFINKNNGFLIESGNELEIKKIIEKVLQFRKKDLESKGKNGYEIVIKNYTWDKMVEKVFSYYKKYYKYEKKSKCAN